MRLFPPRLSWLSACLLLACEARPESASPSATVAPAVSAPAPDPTPSVAVPDGPPLLTPARATATAPDTFIVDFDTTKGKVALRITREWAPRGADRFFNLVKIGYFDDVAFYRVTLEVAQFGLHGDPAVTAAWRDATIMDEMVKQPNTRGRISFARRSADTRTTVVFINLKDNAADYDAQGFAPFGEVIEGMDVVDKLSHEHGERTQMGDAPKRIVAEGNAYLKQAFPKLDYIRKATLR